MKPSGSSSRVSRSSLGRWTVDAAEAVCSDERVPDVLDTLERLVEHNLVVNVQGTPRMRMLERRSVSTQPRDSGGDRRSGRRPRPARRLLRPLHPRVALTLHRDRLHLLDAEWDNIQG